MTRKPEVELIHPADVPDGVEEVQIVDPPDEDVAFQTGFGMGPGLYGSGRHSSEMVGN